MITLHFRSKPEDTGQSCTRNTQYCIYQLLSVITITTTKLKSLNHLLSGMGQINKYLWISTVIKFLRKCIIHYSQILGIHYKTDVYLTLKTENSYIQPNYMGGYSCFRGTYCLHLQGRNNTYPAKRHTRFCLNVYNLWVKVK